MMFKKSILSALLAGAVVFIAGCGQKLPDGMPKLYTTKVVVTYDDGTVIPGATVLLAPVDKSATEDWSSGGTTGEDGSIELFTRGQYQGVPAGAYKATVRKVAVENTEPNKDELDPETYKRAVQKFKSTPGPEPFVEYLLTDAVYNDPVNSPLEITVEAKNGNKFELKVGEPVKDVL